MKSITLLLVAVVIVSTGFTQEDNSKEPQEYKTIFVTDEIVHGGYGGVSFLYTKIDGQSAFLAGMKGVWLINHGIGIGLGGYGFANDITYDKSEDGYSDDYSLAGGYGGIIIEPIVGAKRRVHVSFPVLIGAGGVALIDESWSTPQPNYDSGQNTIDSDAFFVFEPGVELELNMVKFMRVAVGVTYRLTTATYLRKDWSIDSSNDKYDLSGFSTGITLKFGKF